MLTCQILLTILRISEAYLFAKWFFALVAKGRHTIETVKLPFWLATEIRKGLKINWNTTKDREILLTRTNVEYKASAKGFIAIHESNGTRLVARHVAYVVSHSTS